MDLPEGVTAVKKRLALLTVVVGVIGTTILLSDRPDLRAASSAAAPLDVVINEVAWSGTLDDYSDEWIELLNNTGADIDLAGWTLVAADGIPDIGLTGIIPAQGYYLLERSDDNAIRDVPADQVYLGGLEDEGEALELRDAGENAIDAVNSDGGGWPGGTGGTGTPPRASMERVAPDQAGDDANWGTNDGLVRNGEGKDGTPINGTPKARNSAALWSQADLRVDKEGPSFTSPGSLIAYTIVVSNGGQIPAQATWLTDVLPAQVEFITHTAPYSYDQPEPGTLVWDLGMVSNAVASPPVGVLPSMVTPHRAPPISFTVLGRVDVGASGDLTNAVTVTSATTESNPADNYDLVVTTVGAAPPPPEVLIEALYYDAYEPDHVDEAVRLMNVSGVVAHLDGWGITDQDSSPALFPPGATLAPGQAIWCAREATAFERQFGFKPAFEYGADTDPLIPGMDGGIPRFGDGDECMLLDAEGQIVDVLVYGTAVPPSEGWSGDSVEPWTSGGRFGAAGQILYRKRAQSSGQPVPDSDTAADWAQDPDDQVEGRKVMYPGWDLDAFAFTQSITETATLTIAMAPENTFETVAVLLAGAQESIQIETYTFQSQELAGIILDRLGQGVSTTLLLEGAPAFTGVTDQEKWIARQLHEAGAQVLFMVNDGDNDVYDRYDSLHAKFMIIDGSIVVIGTENLNPTGMPCDDQTNGTVGRRGALIATDAPGVAARVEAVFDADADPSHHQDVVSCEHSPALCIPPPDFEPEWTPDWTTYTVRFPEPLITQGVFAFEVVHSPENSLRTQDGLLGLLGRAGSGDTVLVQMSYEHVHWGPADGTPASDPNLRLEAYLDAARRGASVRILLDAHFDQEGDNAETVVYLLGVARTESLDLQARLVDPAFLGVHNKMVLVQIGGAGYVHLGSINGSEVSAKANREMALQVQSEEAYAYLHSVFMHDWIHSVPPLYLPMVFWERQVPGPADYVLISEVYYGSAPEREWVEIYNPTGRVVSLGSYMLGDAAHPEDAEGMICFPPTASIGPYEALVVAVSATGFRQSQPNITPDFEIVGTDPNVPDMVENPSWGTWDWALGNEGDEVLLLAGPDVAVDVVVYGDGNYPGVIPHPGGIDYRHSLERYPVWLDSDDCSTDFRDWPYPSPGALP
jgi:uncharacterized repeat protein (TIGR01451 family)